MHHDHHSQIGPNLQWWPKTSPNLTSTTSSPHFSSDWTSWDLFKNTAVVFKRVSKLLMLRIYEGTFLLCFLYLPFGLIPYLLPRIWPGRLLGCWVKRLTTPGLPTNKFHYLIYLYLLKLKTKTNTFIWFLKADNTRPSNKLLHLLNYIFLFWEKWPK